MLFDTELALLGSYPKEINNQGQAERSVYKSTLCSMS